MGCAFSLLVPCPVFNQFERSRLSTSDSVMPFCVIDLPLRRRSAVRASISPRLFVTELTHSASAQSVPNPSETLSKRRRRRDVTSPVRDCEDREDLEAITQLVFANLCWCLLELLCPARGSIAWLASIWQGQLKYPCSGARSLLLDLLGSVPKP